MDKGILYIVLAVAILALSACARAAPTPTPTLTPRPQVQGIYTPEDVRAQYEAWPDEYKFAIDEDIVVLFSYPSPILDWGGFALIKHIPSVSSVTLGWPLNFVGSGGDVAEYLGEDLWRDEVRIHRNYKSDEGKARLEAVLEDEALMWRILESAPLYTPVPTLTPTPTATPTPTYIVSSPSHEAPLVTEVEPDSFCQDGRMVVWNRPEYVNGTPVPPIPPPNFGWHLVVDPQYPLPPAPGGTVHVRSWFKGRDFETGETLLGLGWEGDHVFIYAFPVPEEMRYPGFWPKKGRDPSLRECLGQAAYLLGKGPVHSEGYLDFLLTIPEIATIGGEPVTLLDLADLGELQLFAVTGQGDFSVGPRVSLAEPYRLTVTPATAEPGDTVVIEGEGLKPQGALLSISTALWVEWDGGTAAKLEIAQVRVREGRIRIEWTIPRTARVATAPPGLRPTPTPTGTVYWNAPTATPAPGLVDGRVKTPQIVPIGVYLAEKAGSVTGALYQTTLFLGLEGRTKKTGP